MFVLPVTQIVNQEYCHVLKSSDLNSNKSYDPNNDLFCRSNDAPCQLNTSDQSDPMQASICFQGEARISVLCRSKSFDSLKI